MAFNLYVFAVVTYSLRIFDANGKMNYQYLFRDYKKKPKKILSNASAFDLVRHTLKDTQNHKMCSLRRIWRKTTTKSFFFELLCPNFGCYLRVIEFDDWKTTDKHDLAKTYNFVLTLLSIYHKLYYHDQCPTAILHHSVKFQFILILLIWIPLLRMNNSIK